MHERLLLNETTRIGILYDDDKNVHIVESKRNAEKLPEIIQKENELEAEQHKLSENIDDLDLINDNIKEKYKILMISVMTEIFLLWLINVSFTSYSVLPASVTGLILTTANAIATTVFELGLKSFNENYRLKNDVLPSSIKNNREKISKLQIEIDEMKKIVQFSKNDISNSKEIEIPMIAYPAKLEQDNLLKLDPIGVKIKNYDFNIN